MSNIRDRFRDLPQTEVRGSLSSLVPALARLTLFSHQVGGGGRDRTDDLMLAKHALSQLSYAPTMVGLSRFAHHEADLVGQGGFEPPTSRLSSARSNQLSY